MLAHQCVGLGTEDPGAGACLLLGESVSQGFWLQGPSAPGASASVLMCGAMFWAFWWTGPGPRVAVGSEGLKEASLLVGCQEGNCFPTS